MARNRDDEDVVAVLTALMAVIDDDDDDDQLLFDKTKKKAHIPIRCDARDVKGDIYGTAFFEPWVGMPTGLYDWLWKGMREPIREPRNIYFEYTDAENKRRRRRPCKISDENRFIEFLHTMNENGRVWTSASCNGWNISSVSRDFIHVLMQFCKTYSTEWICKMDVEEKRNYQGTWEQYPDAYQLMDGSMYRRRKTKNLPDGVQREDYYDHKLKMPEAVDVQAVCNPIGFCTELLTGGPGSMGDANLSQFICQDDWKNSTLVDGTYPQRPQFIKCDGTIEHKRARVGVEWLFGRNKTDWSLTGTIYRKSSRFHNLAIRASFTLSNMKKMWTTEPW